MAVGSVSLVETSPVARIKWGGTSQIPDMTLICTFSNGHTPNIWHLLHEVVLLLFSPKGQSVCFFFSNDVSGCNNWFSLDGPPLL